MKRGASKILYLSKPLLVVGYGCWLILATFGNLVADEPPSPEVAPNAAPLPDNSQAPDDSQTSDNSQAPNNPLLPQQGSNPYLPFSSTSSNAQSPQITTPVLYTTGVNDVSQVATNAALTQAFSQQATSGFLSEPAMGYSYGPIERIRLGPFDLKVALLLNVVSDDNLNPGEQGGEKISDTSFGITPAILLEYGTHDGQKGYASLVYSPTITRFLDYTNEDTFNQNAALTVRYPFQRLTLDLSETYAQVTGINQDVNSRITQTSSVTTFGGNYDIDDKLTFSSHLQELIASYSGAGAQQGQGAQGEGDQTSSLNSSMSYQVSEKMALGPSLNLGLDKPQDAKQETFEQALLGLTYQPTEKISLFAQGGVEFRQGDQDNQGGQTGQGGDTTNPIFSAGVKYTPFDSTTLSVNGYQNVYSSSADSGQTVVNTGVGFSATQRIVQRFYLNLSFNYSHSDYQSGTGGMSTTGGSSQDTLAYRPSLSFAPTAWTSVALYYQYLDNQSSVQDETYHDNQMGIAVSAQF